AMPENYGHYAQSPVLPVISLRINGTKVQNTFSLRIPAVIPFVIFDPTTGNIKGYSNTMMFSIDDFQIASDNLTVSLFAEDILPEQFREALIKFHPGILLETDLKQ